MIKKKTMCISLSMIVLLGGILWNGFKHVEPAINIAKAAHNTYSLIDVSWIIQKNLTHNAIVNNFSLGGQNNLFINKLMEDIKIEATVETFEDSRLSTVEWKLFEGLQTNYISYKDTEIIAVQKPEADFEIVNIPFILDEDTKKEMIISTLKILIKSLEIQEIVPTVYQITLSEKSTMEILSILTEILTTTPEFREYVILVKQLTHDDTIDIDKEINEIHTTMLDELNKVSLPNGLIINISADNYLQRINIPLDIQKEGVPLNIDLALSFENNSEQIENIQLDFKLITLDENYQLSANYSPVFTTINLLNNSISFLETKILFNANSFKLNMDLNLHEKFPLILNIEGEGEYTIDNLLSISIPQMLLNVKTNSLSFELINADFYYKTEYTPSKILRPVAIEK